VQLAVLHHCCSQRHLWALLPAVAGSITRCASSAASASELRHSPQWKQLQLCSFDEAPVRQLLQQLGSTVGAQLPSLRQLCQQASSGQGSAAAAAQGGNTSHPQPGSEGPGLLAAAATAAADSVGAAMLVVLEPGTGRLMPQLTGYSAASDGQLTGAASALAEMLAALIAQPQHSTAVSAALRSSNLVPRLWRSWRRCGARQGGLDCMQRLLAPLAKIAAGQLLELGAHVGLQQMVQVRGVNGSQLSRALPGPKLCSQLNERR
jgi:hypothetical protein